MEISELVEALRPETVTELSVHRLTGQLKPGDSWAIISAYKSERSDAENAEAAEQLLSDIRSHGARATKIKVWFRAEGEKRRQYRYECLTVNLDHLQLHSLANRLAQPGSVWVEKDVWTCVLRRSGEIEPVSSLLDASTLCQAVTNREIGASVCLCVEYLPNGDTDALAWKEDLRRAAESERNT